MNTCKNCKWWGDYIQKSDDVPPSYRGCDYYDDESDAGFEVVVDICDDTGLEVSLFTGPDFGCIKFQNKDTPPK